MLSSAPLYHNSNKSDSHNDVHNNMLASDCGPSENREPFLNHASVLFVSLNFVELDQHGSGCLCYIAGQHGSACIFSWLWLDKLHQMRKPYIVRLLALSAKMFKQLKVKNSGYSSFKINAGYSFWFYF